MVAKRHLFHKVMIEILHSGCACVLKYKKGLGGLCLPDADRDKISVFR